MKKLIFSLMLLCGVAGATSTPVSVVPTNAFEYDLNRLLGAVGLKYSLGTVIRQAHNSAIGVLDFAQQGGAVGSVNIGVSLPTKSVIQQVLLDVITAPTSGGSATIAFGANTTTDLKAATAIASYTTGIIAAIPVETAASAVKLTAARNLTATIGTAALTAGKIKVYVEYFVSE